jgi:hypothetical protein
MSEERDSNPKRRYNAWAGNPQGMAQDPALCVKGVWSGGRGSSEHQCRSKRGPGGYCKIHSPEAVKAREEKSRLRYEADMDRRMAPIRERSRLSKQVATLDALCDEARQLMSDLQDDPGDHATALRVKEWNAKYKAVEK